MGGCGGGGTVCVWQLIAAGLVCFPEKWNVVIAAVIKSQAGDASFFFFFLSSPAASSRLRAVRPTPSSGSITAAMKDLAPASMFQRRQMDKSSNLKPGLLPFFSLPIDDRCF